MRARASSLPPTTKGKQRDLVDGVFDPADDFEPGGNVQLAQIERGWLKWLRRGRLKRRRAQLAKEEIVEIADGVLSAFRPPSRGASFDLRTLDHAPPLDDLEFERIVASIRQAIQQGRHPKLNIAGSSGSYLVRDERGLTVAIFKPKDEDPYGRLNPKWTKWLHRVLLSPLGFGFGRACLIPTFSYLSEAGASLLDRRLGSYIVPHTEISSLSSPSFYYDWIDRHAAHRKDNPKSLPDKPGSLQLFAHGFRDASQFLSEHPWPGRLPEEAINMKRHRARRRRQLSRFTKWLFFLRRENPAEEDVASIETLDAEQLKQRLENDIFEWTAPLMEDFRLQLEKLVILDMLIRNTDRGLDNFMIKYCPAASEDGIQKDRHCPSHAHMHVAAIDNSLAFPHEHPAGWRNYTYGWLWLPASLLAPFSRATREHYLPLLTSPSWWAELTRDLRVLFSLDPDFSESMFSRQLAVIKGQAYNIIQSLLEQGDGPVELFERRKCLVWDDVIEVADLSSPTSVRSDSRRLRGSMRPSRWASATHTRQRDEESSLLPRKLAIQEVGLSLLLECMHIIEILTATRGGARDGVLSIVLNSCTHHSPGEDAWPRAPVLRLTSDLVLAALQPGSLRGHPEGGERRSLDELLVGPWRTSGEDHREALLHEVQKGDTVAGIALQYGLSAQALRQANRLWSNDSIHLRKTLYIPLDSCTMPPAKECIERIEVEGDTVTIFSRALPRKPPPQVAPPPPRALLNGSAARRSTSLDLERLPASSRTSMDSNASFYLPETNAAYTEPLSPTFGNRLVEVEEPLAPLVERKLKLGLVPLPPSSTQPFFRLSPSSSSAELDTKLSERSRTAVPKPKAEAVPMRLATSMWSSVSGWSIAADEAELAMAEDYLRRSKRV